MRTLLTALLLLAAWLPGGSATDWTGDSDDSDMDDDSDSAPFMVVVEHDAGGTAWRCSGSLVSLRTGVTSAECARGRRPHPTRDLWVVTAVTAAGQATRADGARRVSRVATAGAHQQEVALNGAWSGAMLDLAVLELESPFGSAADPRPILMATAPQECASGAPCYVARALSKPGMRHMRVRIVDITLATDAPCAQTVHYWAALRDRALCLTGNELCQQEWGAGIVCGGKLCGVLSRSTGNSTKPDCGDTHAAQSVARWRRFLHCAHTLRACGRGSCADLCSERKLLDESEADSDTEMTTTTISTSSRPPPPPPPAPLQPPPVAARVAPHVASLDLAHLAAPQPQPAANAAQATPLPPTRVRLLPEVKQTGRTLPSEAEAPPGLKPARTTWARLPGRGMTAPLPPGAGRPAPLFEPNRPDFKAGEYGDNAADYGAAGDDGLPQVNKQLAWAPVGAGAVPGGGGGGGATTTDAEGATGDAAGAATTAVKPASTPGRTQPPPPYSIPLPPQEAQPAPPPTPPPSPTARRKLPSMLTRKFDSDVAGSGEPVAPKIARSNTTAVRATCIVPLSVFIFCVFTT